ncbi:Uncharacterized conserved protein YjiS, DUF1127 family [Yoonia tamlensis]|uniref:Uncharacterized conserved protein YjiS, DUF1127 family n=1 Tax=Yoonia tamlensis TaxID=390270 RepID=A0A1I6FWI9_9RHOB|nr:DUF1127 domain-containing protein [Yoonia tamlensis]SFR34322.1 Uncharacterized conserved protein YjiS, DUF1127 family [Yoonia tamlensis]
MITTKQHAATWQPHRPINLFTRLRTAIGTARQRRHLRQLDAHLLCDIGISRDAALREANRPIWDAPKHWCARRN